MAAVQKRESDSTLGMLLEENREGLLTCVHCGLCLPSCPTYRELGNENDSPRGRIYLMRAVVEGRIAAAETYTSHIDLCLGCRACEPVCPSGVPYGQLLEAARAKVAEVQQQHGSPIAHLTAFVLNRVFTRPAILRFGFRVTRLFRDSGLAQLALESGVLGGRLRFALAMLAASKPTFKVSPGALANGGQELSGHTAKERGSAVGVLRGCVMEGLFRETNRATERVLAINGCTVLDVPDQMCCGALHAHAGQIDTATRLARRNIDAFLEAGVERIVVNAAGCGAAMKEYGHLLAGDPAYAGRAREFSSKVRDVSEFLAEIGIKGHERTGPAGSELKVAYDAPCHVIHAQRIVDQPLQVLKSIPGLKLVPLQGYETCCGGAGIYNLLNPELSGRILATKLENIGRSGAEVVVTSNPGCLLQIGAGLLLERSKVRVVQVVDLLNAAYSGDLLL